MSARRVLITGASGGLGSAMVSAFDNANATVFALDLEPPAIGTQAHFLECDLSDAQSVGDAIEDLDIDILINNAAIFPMTAFNEMSFDTYRQVQSVNVDAAVLLMAALSPGMIERGFGRVINITSITLSGGWENLSAYVASKGALMGLTRAWAREFGPSGITVNAIAPGAIPTQAEKIHPDLEAYEKFVIDHQAIKQRGSAEDIARTALFLADETTGFVTGQTLHVNGGWTMQ